MARERKYYGEPTADSNQIKKPENVDIIGPEHGTDSVDIIQDVSGTIGHYKRTTNLDISNAFMNEAQQIDMYRRVSEHPEVEAAIDEIINEIFVTDGEALPIEINLDEVEDLTDEKKKSIEESFYNCMRLLNFSNDAYDIFRSFYVDGKIYYYKIVDEYNKTSGIQNLKWINPVSIRKIREIFYAELPDGERKEVVGEKEYYIYLQGENAYSSEINSQIGGGGFGGGYIEQDITSRNGIPTRMIMESEENIQNYINENFGDFSSFSSFRKITPIIIEPKAIASASSGYLDSRRGIRKGFLNRCVKPLNDMISMESHMMIYRLSRASEKRIFYIDTGMVPQKKAAQLLNSVKDNFRRQVTLDSETGAITGSDPRQISIHEDIFLSRSKDGRGTQVETLPGASNLDQIEDVQYMRKRFERSLNIPLSRISEDGRMQSRMLGIRQELEQDELKFQKFISRLRSKFNVLLRDILGSDVQLREILDESEWNSIAPYVTFKYAKDTYIEDSRRLAVISAKMEIAREMQDFVGKYVSRQYVMQEILGFSDAEVKELQDQIEVERVEDKKNGVEEDSFY